MDSGNVISAFSEDQVERLTGLSKARLRYWDRTGFFKPAFAAENRRVAFSRIYSFRDVASLRVLDALRDQFGVPLQHLRRVAVELRHLEDEKWTAVSLYVIGRKVHFHDPETDQVREAVSGQFILPFPLKAVVDSTREAVRALAARQSSAVGKIEKHRAVKHNLPVLSGTRIPVSSIAAYIEDGFSDQAILKEYPSLSDEDIEAVRRQYAGRKVA